jgi:hypothetical protein
MQCPLCRQHIKGGLSEKYPAGKAASTGKVQDSDKATQKANEQVLKEYGI